jgi:hypothetical protein
MHPQVLDVTDTSQTPVFGPPQNGTLCEFHTDALATISKCCNPDAHSLAHHHFGTCFLNQFSRNAFVKMKFHARALLEKPIKRLWSAEHTCTLWFLRHSSNAKMLV